MRYASMDVLKKRLAAWEREKETNANGMAYLADRAVALLKKQIEELERRIPATRAAQG